LINNPLEVREMSEQYSFTIEAAGINGRTEYDPECGMSEQEWNEEIDNWKATMMSLAPDIIAQIQQAEMSEENKAQSDSTGAIDTLFGYHTGYEYVQFDYDNDPRFSYDKCNQRYFDEDEWQKWKKSARELQKDVADFELTKENTSPTTVGYLDIARAATRVCQVLFGPLTVGMHGTTEACILVERAIWLSLTTEGVEDVVEREKEEKLVEGWRNEDNRLFSKYREAAQRTAIKK
jgi:hypothetical protein